MANARRAAGKSRTATRLAAAVAVAAAAVATVVVVVRARRAHEAARAESGDATGDGAPGLRFAPGTEYRYAFSWQSRQQTQVTAAAGASTGGGAAGGGLDGRVDLRGHLLARAYRALPGGWLLGLRFADLEAHEIAVAGRSLAGDGAALANAEVFVEVRRDGGIGELRFRPGASDLFEHAVTALLPELDFRVGGGVVAAPGPFGASRARHTPGRASGGRFEVSRVREAYDTLAVLPIAAADLARLAPALESAATLALAPAAPGGDGKDAGPWGRVEDHEHLRVAAGGGAGAGAPAAVDAEVSLRLELVDSGPATGGVLPALADLARRRLGEPRASSDGARFALEQKAAGLTRGELLEGLSAAGAIADMNRWVWRATGLLQLDPALCDELGRLVAAGRLTGKSAELGLDLLAGAGTPAAQAALRAALASPAVGRAAAADRALLVQRMSLVQSPTPDTAAFAADLYRREHSGAAAYALGSVVGNLAREGERELAGRLAHALVADLSGARDGRQRAHLLGALGNAGLPENVDVVAREAGSDDAVVRAAAARALRQTDTPRAHEALRALVADDAAAVQAEALSALGHMPLAPADLEALSAEVARDGVRPGNEERVVTLLASYAAASPEAAATLRALAAQPGTLPETRTRIRMLLARL